MKTGDKVKCGLAILAACSVLTAMAQYPYCFGFVTESCDGSIQNPDGSGTCNLDDSYGDMTYLVVEPYLQTYSGYCGALFCYYDCDGTNVGTVNGITGGLYCDGGGLGCGDD